MTLVELLVALVVMSIISTAAFSILYAATGMNRYTQSQDAALWDAEMAWHRLLSNGRAALSTTSFPIAGAAPTVATDSNGQSRLTLTVPDIANATTRTVVYYCSGAAAPYTLMENDPRYNVGGNPSIVARNVQSFSVSLTTTNGEQIWTDLRLAPPNTGFVIRRHICIDCRNF
jgi:prepilin-type N-terminal cleavage/methylation domain-containing protein